MKTHSGKSVILGSRALGENDKLIFLYSEELGKLKAIAKGGRKIKSKFTGQLETLNISQTAFYFSPRNTILTEISLIKSFKSMRDDLQLLSNALQISEITDKLLFDNQTVDGLLPLIEQTLQELNNSKRPLLISLAYISKFLDKIGFLPDFKTLNTNLEEKYLKFLNFIKTQPYSSIQKITLSPKEILDIKSFFQKIIAYQTEKTINSFSITH